MEQEPTADSASLALQWLVSMGADEAIGDQPVNRFETPAAPVAPAALVAPAAQVEVVAPAMPSAPVAPVAMVAPATPVAPVAPVAPAALPASDEATADARRLAAGCNSLDDLKKALETFDACPLKRTAANLCLSDGLMGAHVMLIGEAPGRDEDIQGKPFVGRSGQLLDQMLAALSLSRHAEDPNKAVFISNMLFWRPPGNRKPTEAETLMCQPFVQRLIELARPEIIMCLGATPTQRLTGQTQGILRLRGRWFEHEAGGRKIPLLATLHPAYLLRQPAQKRLAWRDLLALEERLNGKS